GLRSIFGLVLGRTRHRLVLGRDLGGLLLCRLLRQSLRFEVPHGLTMGWAGPDHPTPPASPRHSPFSPFSPFSKTVAQLNAAGRLSPRASRSSARIVRRFRSKSSLT